MKMGVIDAQTRNAHCEASHDGEHSTVKLQTKNKAKTF